MVLSIRSDFLDRVAEDQQFVDELTQGLFFLGPPNREGLRDAILQPAELAGFKFELAATVDDMLDHLETTPGALPLLQFAASKLWENRDTARRMLTHQAYAAMGGVAGALASHADRVIQEIGPTKNALVRALLLRLVSPERTRSIVPMEELRELSREVGEVQRLVDQMVDARLLVVQNTAPGATGKGTTVEIVHESLIHSWPALRRWLDETQEDAVLIDQLRTAARQWHVKGRSPDLLWRGDTADEATKFRKRYKGPLSDVERAFLDEITSYETAVQRRRRSAIIAGFVGLGLLVVAAMVALVFIQKSRTEAKKQAIVATEAKAAAESDKKIAVEAKKTAEDANAQVVQKQKEAEDALHAMQEKERERQAALTEVVDVKHQSAEDLAKKNGELTKALEESKKSEERAKVNAAAAEHAKADAMSAKSQTEVLLRQEQERVKKIQAQIGSSIVDDLK